MPLYRALRNLSGVAKRGTLTRLSHLDEAKIAKLEQVGAVARVSPPPLSELPSWESRAGKLAKVDILDAEQLIEAEVETVANALRVKPETARSYQQEMMTFLILPEPSTEE